MNAPGRLSRLIADVPVSKAQFDEDLETFPAPSHCYAILFISRSGSTWLADLLSRQGDLGKPREYLNLDMIARFAAEVNANTLPDYFAMLGRRRATANGVFGLKVGWAQLGLLAEEGLVDRILSGYSWIYLRRRNLVAQAVSLYKARSTGDYQRRRTDTAELRKALDEKGARVEYDAAAIARYMEEIVAGERAAEAMIESRGILPLRIVYEDMMAADEVALVSAVRRLLFATGTLPPSVRPSNIVRSGNVQNLEFESRFRLEHDDLVGDLERQRRPLDSDHGHGSL